MARGSRCIPHVLAGAGSKSGAFRVRRLLEKAFCKPAHGLFRENAPHQKPSDTGRLNGDDLLIAARLVSGAFSFNEETSDRSAGYVSRRSLNVSPSSRRLQAIRT